MQNVFHENSGLDVVNWFDMLVVINTTHIKKTTLCLSMMRMNVLFDSYSIYVCKCNDAVLQLFNV